MLIIVLANSSPSNYTQTRMAHQERTRPSSVGAALASRPARRLPIC